MLTEDEKKLVKEAQEQLNEAKEGREPFTKFWKVSEAFLAGFHNIVWSEGNSDIRPAPTPPSYRVRVVINDVERYYRREVGRLSSHRPEFECVPATSDLDDVISASKCEKLLRYFDTRLETPRVDIDFKQLLVVHGAAFLKVRWDEFGRDDTGRSVGEVAVDPIPAWNVFVFPFSARSVADAQCVFHQVERSLKYVKARFPKAAENIKEGSGKSLFEGVGERLLSYLHGRFGGAPASGRQGSKSVVLTERWTNPCQEYPRGHFMVMAGDVLLHQQDGFPYSDEIPIYEATYTSLPGVFWGLGLLYSLCVLNARRNRAASQVLEYMNRSLSGMKWLLPAGCGVNPDQITNDPMEKIRYNPMTADGKVLEPKMIQPPPLPQGAFAVDDKLLRDMDNMASQHEVSQGLGPRNVESGKGVQYLQEADVLPLGPTATRIESAWQRAYRMMLRLAQRFYVEDRLLRFYGEGRSLEVLESFSKRDIRPNVDVLIRPGSGLPRSRSQQRQEVIDLVATQILMPDEARRILQVHGSWPHDPDQALDIGYQQQENADMVRGVMRTVNFYDNHPLHMHELFRYMKQPLFRKIPAQLQMLFAQHAKGHIIAMQALAPEQPAEEEQPRRRPATTGRAA